MNALLAQKLKNIYLTNRGKKGSSAWLEMADVIRDASLTSQEEYELVTAALRDVSVGAKNLPGYRTNIIKLAHPRKLEMFNAARNARTGPKQLRIGVMDLVAIAVQKRFGVGKSGLLIRVLPAVGMKLRLVKKLSKASISHSRQQSGWNPNSSSQTHLQRAVSSSGE